MAKWRRQIEGEKCPYMFCPLCLQCPEFSECDTGAGICKCCSGIPRSHSDTDSIIVLDIYDAIANSEVSLSQDN